MSLLDENFKLTTDNDFIDMKSLKKNQTIYLLSSQLEEILTRLFNSILNDEIEKLNYSVNLSQIDMFYNNANSIQELLDFLMSDKQNILYNNKLVIIKNPDDTLKLYELPPPKEGWIPASTIANGKN